MSLVYTELYHDDFQRPNENPLDPARWVEHNAPPNLQLLNHLCTTEIVGQDDGQAMFNQTLPSDQYAEATLNQMVVNGNLDLYLRGNLANLSPAYVLDLTGNFNDPSNTFYRIAQLNSGGSGFDHIWANFLTGLTIAQGDVVRFSVMGGAGGGKIRFDLNGTNVFTGNLSDSSVQLSSGKTGMQLATITASPSVNDISISRWAAGTVVDPSAGGGMAWVNRERRFVNKRG